MLRTSQALLLSALTIPAWAQDATAPAPKKKEIPIGHLMKDPRKAPGAEEDQGSGIKFTSNCTSNGTVYAKGDKGYDTCISQAGLEASEQALKTQRDARQGQGTSGTRSKD